jgi:ABC-type phosphate transport system substrate-binding protein
MVVGPIALAYNVAGVGNLALRPATIAKIFAGTATAWNDPAIAADNPGVVLPSTRITTVHRADSSGTTDNFTDFLRTTAAGDWTYGHRATWPVPGGTAERRVVGERGRSDGGVPAGLRAAPGPAAATRDDGARRNPLARPGHGDGPHPVKGVARSYYRVSEPQW